MKSLRILLVLVAMAAIVALPSIAAPKEKAGAKSAPAKVMEMTGVHRGYTNDELYVRRDDGGETTFLVRIPGDSEWKWHKQFEINDAIAVTYHQESGEKRPIATAIRKAAK